MSVQAKGGLGKMEGVGGVIRKADKVQPKTTEVPKKQAEGKTSAEKSKVTQN